MNLTNSTSVTTIRNLDLSNVTTSFQYIDQPAEGAFFRHFENVILPCIILVGLIGNLTFIWTVIRMPSLHASTYIYLTTLACTDLFTLMGIVGFTIYEMFTEPLRSKNIFLLQTVSEMVAWFSFIWSLCLVTLTSLERYLAICRPIKHHLLKGTRRTFKMIAVTFLFTLVMSCTIVPHVFDFSVLHLYSQITYIIYVIFFTSCLTYNCFMYIRVLQTLKQRQRNKTLQLSPEFERNIQEMAIMIIVNGLTFFIFSSIVSAYYVTFVFNLFKGSLHKHLFYDKIFEYVQITSIIFNASVNPIIYFITNRRYRDALKTSIAKPCCKGK